VANPERRMRLKVRIGIYVLALCAGAAYAASPYRVGFVCGESMSPALSNGEFYVLERASCQQLKRGDVVVFRQNGLTYLKRILATPGDRFYVIPRIGVGDTDELIDAQDVDRVRQISKRYPYRGTWRLVERKVPAGHLYVVGDHLERSEDSRGYGFVEISAIEGRLVKAPPPTGRLVRVARGVHSG
jgi:signal peptidase I